MTVFLAGGLLLGGVLGLFWWQDVSDRAWLTRFAYSRFIARLAVLGSALIVVGGLLVVSDLMK